MKNLIYSLIVVITLSSCSKDEQTPDPPPTPTFTLNFSADTGGTVSTEGGTYNQGSKITVTATPEGQFLFKEWSDGSTQNPREITVTSNLTLKASFIKKTYPLSVTIDGEGTVQEQVIIQGSTTETEYNAGTTVRLTAIPNEGWEFSMWVVDGMVITENPIEVAIEKGREATVFFKRTQFELNITIEGEGTVKEEVIVQPGQYDYEMVVRLTAVPADGWEFVGWSGDVTSEENPIELQIKSINDIVASFLESNIVVKRNTTTIQTSVTPQDVQRTFEKVSGVFPYESGGEFYSFFPGAADWVSGYSNEQTKNDIPSMPSQILKRVNGRWEFFKTDTDAYFWGARNFKIIGNHIAIGDGNEIGPDGAGCLECPKTERNWSGDAYFGKIQEDGNIYWKKVNDLSNRIYFHGTTLGDINGDGLLDVGGAPNEGTDNLKIFLQQSDGSFSVEDDLIALESGRQPFAIEFFDLDKDGMDEIITANYVGRDPRVDPSLNNIDVYKYNKDSQTFKVVFQSNSSTAFYNDGMGATSIKCADFDNDGIYDISVARENLPNTEIGRRTGHSFDIWKGLPDGTFVPHFACPVWTENEMMFREFDLLDVNNDGFIDIILRPFHYGSLYRLIPNVPVHLSGGIKLNTIIQINDGTGRFSAYDKEDLVIENLNVQNLHPYMDGDTLHFVGTYTPDRNVSVLETVDIVVKIKK